MSETNGHRRTHKDDTSPLTGAREFAPGNGLGTHGSRPGQRNGPVPRALRDIEDEMYLLYHHGGHGNPDAETKLERAFHRLFELLESKDERIALETAKYLINRACGKPKARVEISTRRMEILARLDERSPAMRLLEGALGPRATPDLPAGPAGG